VKELLPTILDFMKAAGEIALHNYQHATNVQYKSEATTDIITETDIAVSKLFRPFCATHFSDMDCVIVDEESVSELGDNPFAEIVQHEYQFVIDPIDGTLPYALGIPMFGISVGVLRQGKPFAGAVYAPALGELVYGDLHSAYWMKNAFAANQTLAPLEPRNGDKNGLLMGLGRFAKPNSNINIGREVPVNFYAAVVHMLYLATRGRAYYFGVCAWDIAGAWALLKYLGFEVINYHTEKILEKLDPADFTPQFRIKDTHIVCKPAEFARLKHIADPIYP